MSDYQSSSFRLRAAIELVYRSFVLAGSPIGLPDAQTRDPSYAKLLLEARGLLPTPVPLIVVGGSKGKGSTVRALVALLAQLGYQVGWVTSPNLGSFLERIRLNDELIPEGEFCELAEELRPSLEALIATLPSGRYVGPHAAILTIALSWFARRGANVIVVEDGRGGRYDESSVLGARLAVISTILGEHRLELGPSLADVAWHKAGLLPVDGQAVIGAVGPAARAILLTEGQARHTRLEWLGRQVRVEEGTPTRLITPDGIYRVPHFGLAGEYQHANAALALRAAELFTGGPLDPGRVARALARLVSPGHLTETVVGGRQLLLDTAVNRVSAGPILAWLEGRRAGGEPAHLLLCVPTDKDVTGLARALAPACGRLTLVTIDKATLHFDRAALRRLAHSLANASDELAVGLESALANSRPGSPLALVGTQSFIAGALAHFGLDTAAFRADEGEMPAGRALALEDQLYDAPIREAAGETEVLLALGPGRAILVAGHATPHWRARAWKVADHFTGPLVLEAARQAHCAALVVAAPAHEDSNSQAPALRGLLASLLEATPGRFVLDVHGMRVQPDGVECLIGGSDGPLPGSLAEYALACAGRHHINARLALTGPYAANAPERLSRYVQAVLGCPAIQLELAPHLRSPRKQPERFGETVDFLAELAAWSAISEPATEPGPKAEP